MRGRDGVGVLLLAATAIGSGAIFAVGAQLVGPLALVALLAAPAAFALVLRPKITLGLLLAGVVVLESDDETFLSEPANVTAFYGGTPVAGLGLVDLLLALLIAGVVLHALRRRRFVAPDPFTLPLLLLAVAVVFGLVQGAWSEPLAVDVANTLRRLLPLIMLPFAAVNLLETREDVDRGLRLLLALVAYKAITGAVGWSLGSGRELDGTVLTYYGSAANLLLMGFLLVLVAALGARTSLPAAAWWLAPLAFAVLVLSFRRNFWIATVLGVVLVLLVASGRRGRALLIPGVAVIAVALYLGSTAISGSQSQSPVIQRAQSFAPSKLQARSEDRYRLDEQRNVIAELARHPLTGIGIGVPWTVRYPLAEVFPNGRSYTHVVVFWYWLKLGLTGLVAYLLLQFATVHAGLRLWRRAGAPRDRVLGLGAAATMLGLAVAETTGSFTGVDPRTTVLLAIALGGLAALLRLERTASEARVPALAASG